MRDRRDNVDNDNVMMVTREEMMTFSAQMHRMAERKLPFERLVVDASLALKIFQVGQLLKHLVA